jgi:hypothetical protein
MENTSQYPTKESLMEALSLIQDQLHDAHSASECLECPDTQRKLRMTVLACEKALVAYRLEYDGARARKEPILVCRPL